MKPLLILAITGSFLALSPSLFAQSITWGSVVGEDLRDSEGNKLTKSWQFELGVFLPGFYPTEDNIAEWVSKWLPLDRADYNEAVGYFSSRAPAPEPPAAGLQAYIWIYNRHKYNPDSEWLLLTDRDGKNSNDWMIPNRSTDPAAAIVDWRVSRATTVLMGHARRVTAADKAKPSNPYAAKAKIKLSYSTGPIPAKAIAAAAGNADAERKPTALAEAVAEE